MYANKYYGQDLIKVGGEWIVSSNYSKGLSDNLEIFRGKPAQNKTPEEAAFATPTGKWAFDAGFTKVKFVKEKYSSEIIVPTISDNIYVIFEK